MPVAAPAAAADIPLHEKSFLDRLQIRYFSETMGSPLGSWKQDSQFSNNFNTGGAKKNSDGTYGGNDPVNSFHQLSFNYALTKKTTVVIQPRFTTQWGNTQRYLSKNADKSWFRIEDFRMGFQGVYLSNKEGTLTWFSRYAVRLPSDQNNQNNNVWLEPEIYSSIDWVANKKWAFFLWNSYRHYLYHSPVRDQKDRYRFYSAPGVIYTFNDKWQFEIFYENEVVHNKPRPGRAGGRKYNYLISNYEDIYAGPVYVVNPSLTLFPFVRFLQVKDWTDLGNTTTVGLWIMARLW